MASCHGSHWGFLSNHKRSGHLRWNVFKYIVSGEALIDWYSIASEDTATWSYTLYIFIDNFEIISSLLIWNLKMKFVPSLVQAGGLPCLEKTFSIPQQLCTWLESYMVLCTCGLVLDNFTHILQDYFIGLGAIIVQLLLCQQSNPEENW